MSGQQDLDQLSELVFRNRPAGIALMELELHNMTNEYELFRFCTDILTKGLILLHGENNAINLESLTMHKFLNVCDCLKVIGILVVYEFIDEQGFPPGVIMPTLHIPGKKLQDYAVLFVTPWHVMRIRFDIKRNIPQIPMHYSCI